MKYINKTHLAYILIFAGGIFSGIKYNEYQNRNNIIVKNKEIQNIDKVWNVVSNNFIISPSEKERKAMMNGAIKGMLAEIDPHSVWWANGQQDVLKDKLSGSYGGIGVVYQFDDKEKLFKVKAVKKDGPAYNAGVKINDIILSINHVSYKDKSFLQLFKGKIGSDIILEVKSEGVIKNYTMKRQEIDGFSVYSSTPLINKNKWLNIKINDFEENTVNEIASEIRNNWYTINQDNGGIILDLRGSPGGLVDVSAGVASLFMEPNKKVTNIHTRNGKDIDFKTVQFPTEAWTHWAKTTNIVIWVDSNTASAAEILASALKDNKRANVIIGMPTFGKGTVQQTFPIDDNKEQATFTIGFYKTPNNRYLQGSGVVPDIVLKFPDEEYITKREKDISNSLISPKTLSITEDKPVKTIEIKQNLAIGDSLDDIYTKQTENYLSNM